jgi:hypothetical protein
MRIERLRPSTKVRAKMRRLCKERVFRPRRWRHGLGGSEDDQRKLVVWSNRLPSLDEIQRYGRMANLD